MPPAVAGSNCFAQCSLPSSAHFFTMLDQMMPSSTVSNRCVTAWRTITVLNCWMTRFVSSHSVHGRMMSAYMRVNAVGVHVHVHDEVHVGRRLFQLQRIAQHGMLVARTLYPHVYLRAISEFIIFMMSGMKAMSQYIRPLCSI